MPDGTFQVRGLRPGRARISLYSNSPLIRPQVVSVEHAGLGIAEAFEIQPGRSVSDLRVVVAYGTGVIRGSVKFVGGTPSQNMRVGINCVREGTRVPAGGGQVDERGHFLLRGLAPGRYEVSLQVVPMTRGQRPPPPQKQLVTVTNEVESEANFVLDLSSTTGGP
jgi:hypothetical protein